MVFLPYVVSTSIVGFFAILLYDPNIGVMNGLLSALYGPESQKAWLGDPSMVFKIFICTVIWQCIGAGMMIFFADMQNIPQEIIDSSVIDGANGWQRFMSIILPSLGASFNTNITTSVIFAWTMFDIPYVLVGPQGGVNNKLDFVNMVFYRYAFGGTYFGETSIGFGSSISVTMFFIILLFTLVARKMLRFGKDGLK
jgi:ABC-type sugar transport system permease subunit